MKPIIIDNTHRKCPYCYAEIERRHDEPDSAWTRHIYCSKQCAGKGGLAERKRRMAAKKRVICGDS